MLTLVNRWQNFHALRVWDFIADKKVAFDTKKSCEEDIENSLHTVYHFTQNCTLRKSQFSKIGIYKCNFDRLGAKIQILEAIYYC